jgi:manganese-dependent inorganic pyrophosphatase
MPSLLKNLNFSYLYMNEIKVFGHQSPDTDATCSAIVWAWFLSEHRGQPAQAYLLGEPNTEAKFVLETWGVDTPPVLTAVTSDDVVSIVDTNNADELFENINDAYLLSIIDHHKLTGGLRTTSPREIVIQPYASTMTVMYNVMNIEPADFPREIAGLMLSGILSDTLEFRSPTTTDTDKLLAENLAKALGADITEYANDMFTAKSDVSHMSDEELIMMDSKILEVKDLKLRVSVVETTDPKQILDRKESIAATLEKVSDDEGVAQVLFYVVDILKQEATMLLQNDAVKAMAHDAFNVPTENDTVVLPGVVSRKKQIFPALLA